MLGEQAVPGVPAIEGELNPAAWMLEITTPGMEDKLGVDFAQVYKESDLARYVPCHIEVWNKL